MKSKIQVLVQAVISSILIISCSGSDSYQRGNWKVRSVFDGVPRSNVVGFVIDNKGYMGTGYDGDDYLKDFWEYDFEGDYWIQKADFPGSARTSASGFALNGKGYLGIGYDGDTELSDFWQYDPNSNSWTQKADFGGGVRRAATGFAVNGSYGYIGTGYDGDNDRKDFWKYDPSSNEWSEMVGFGGNKRRDATSFIIDNTVYLGTGASNGIYLNDFWKFDPTSEVWTRLQDLDEDSDYNIKRSNAVGFSINGLGYIVGGYASGAISSTWEYDPTSDTWEEITSLEATARQDALSFTNGSRGYVLLGRSGSLFLDDVYELFPQEEYDDAD